MIVAKEFDPRKQRLSYKTSYPKPYTLRKLTELQLAVLACARDDLIRGPFTKYAAGQSFLVYVVFGRFDVTNQIKSLRKRRLIKYPTRDQRHDAHFSLTDAGLAELAEHPEF